MQPTINQALSKGNQDLSAITDTPQLEAEILLAHITHKSRHHLYAWPEKTIDSDQYTGYLDLIKKRLTGFPIAYLVGHKEFWSLDLLVSADVLIPRPETEGVVELVLQTIQEKNAVIADLGTGSGAIALALAHERPEWIIHATDTSSFALELAKKNAGRFNLENIIFHQGDWCKALPNIDFHAIVSNPPYIAENEIGLTSKEVSFEPKAALFSPENGLKDLSQIISQAKAKLLTNGLLVLEHGWNQAKEIKRILEKEGYNSIKIYQDLAGKDRVTIALWTGF